MNAVGSTRMRCGKICKVVVLVLLSTLAKGDLPEDDFRIINGQDLLADDSDVFEDKESKSFSRLLFDVARDQVIVGARDAIYRLSLRGLRQLERAAWPASEATSKMCQDKGQTEDDCHNYVKVLLTYGHRLFACGTNAFSPECSWREIESLNTVKEKLGGKASCPYSPHSNVTGLLASTGEYYAGTPTDFAGSDTVICRSRGAAVQPAGTLCTPLYDLSWLNEPQFVGSFEDERHVYFVFREVAVEFMNCGKIIYSRVARMCKNDPGGYVMMKDNWSTFLKARLQCAVPGAAPGDVPFAYDEVQAVEYLPQEKLLVATFTTPSNSIAGSAVCIYSLADIHAAFDGPFKVQEKPSYAWTSHAQSRDARDHFRCDTDVRHESLEHHRYILMHEPVRPSAGVPVYRAASERFAHVTADVVSAAGAVGGAPRLVLYVSTRRSHVIKLSVLPGGRDACLVERWQLDGHADVLAMQFVKETMSVYIGSSAGVLRVGAARCSRRVTREACVRARDPHCGWDAARGLCVRATAPGSGAPLEQDTDRCSPPDVTVDGGWSSWSEWAVCEQHGAPPPAFPDGAPDTCRCRTRRCDSPAPKHGGRACQGASISVSNCTVHGGWSAWSGWSACSATCGIAVKSRRRTCSAPEPRHGGRGCVGLDSHDIYCNNLPPCPDPALAPIDGGWSAWGAWSACEPAAGAGAVACGAGGGWRERRRTCTQPEPRHGGVECPGARTERQPCDLRPCEVRKATAWTPWVQIPGNTSDGSYTEKRFRFTCKAPTAEQIRLSPGREEQRYCTARGACSNTPPSLAPAAAAEDEAWDAWGEWSACTAACGGGQQSRVRRCRRRTCAGAASMLRACNTHACAGEWSCWSEWGACSGGCGDGAPTGHRTRTRRCLSPAGCDDAGAALERRVCVNNCDESTGGWGAWGAWSACSGGERVRRRGCAAGACAGPQLQVALCADDDDADNELNAMPAYSQNVEMASFVTTAGNETLSVGSIVGCVVAAFVMGCLSCLAGVAWWRARGPPCRRAPRVPSSPHYITANQNSYVTVPLKDVPRKAKRQPSFTGIGGSSGLAMPKSNNISNANNHNTAAAVTPKLYPKAIANEYDSMGTLRRHSNQPSHKNNLDLEEDKFY